MLVVCVGTETEVGKTWVGSQVLASARAAGRTVAARKPAQSFDPDDPRPTDADALAAATGELPHHVCPAPRWYPIPMAPPMAAEALHQPPATLSDLLAETTWPTPAPQLCWVETVGGVRSPLAIDGDSVDLCHALRPDLVVLVAHAGLGTISAVRLAAGALAAHPVVVLLNHFDPNQPLHEANRIWLTERDRMRVAIDIPGLEAMTWGR